MIENSLKALIAYIEGESFEGYDPYDTLNSIIPLSKLGMWIPFISIQLQKRNPLNIRPLLGIKKGINPKGIGLMLNAFSKLYFSTGDYKYLEMANKLFKWLDLNYSKGYSGKCWGYNFDWASRENYLVAYTPSVVVTSFVLDGIFEYYRATKDDRAKEIIIDSSRYVTNDIPVIRFPEGISFSYTHLSKGCCYNASLLAAEILAKSDFVSDKCEYKSLIESAVSFVLSKQKTDGSWNYSINPETNEERNQIDFHQGFILVSLSNLKKFCENEPELDKSISKGLEFYRSQFHDNGQAYWRMPKNWPVDIHNLSQGIIVFSKLWKYNPDYKDFASVIADWTIRNMQSGRGFFYYQKNRFYTNRISYMRWAQAWMLLALTELTMKNG